MQFGLFTTLYDCGGGAETPAAVLDHLREQVVLAGAARLRRGVDGRAPLRAVLGSATSPIRSWWARTWRCGRAASGSARWRTSRPWWHPIRLAEDLALLDNLTRGRVDVGFGRGIWPYEGPQFHPHADPRKDGPNFAGSLSRDRRDRAEGLDRGALRPPGPELHVPGARHAVRASPLSAGSRLAGRRPRAQAARHAEALPAAPSAALDDGVDRPLGELRRGAGAAPLLLAAAAAPGPAAHGTLRGDPLPPGGAPGFPVGGAGRAAEPLRGADDGGGAPGGRGADPVRLHLQRSLPRARGVRRTRARRSRPGPSSTGSSSSRATSWSARRSTSPSGCRSWRRSAGWRRSWWSTRIRESPSG